MSDSSYLQLARRLDAIPNGFPQTDSGVELRLLAKVFAPEEAALAAEMRLTPEPAVTIAARAGVDAREAQRTLKQMVRKGLILARRGEGQLVFGLMPFVVGFYEEQLPRMDEELALLFEQYLQESREGRSPGTPRRFTASSRSRRPSRSHSRSSHTSAPRNCWRAPSPGPCAIASVGSSRNSSAKAASGPSATACCSRPSRGPSQPMARRAPSPRRRRSSCYTRLRRPDWSTRRATTGTTITTSAIAVRAAAACCAAWRSLTFPLPSPIPIFGPW